MFFLMNLMLRDTLFSHYYQVQQFLVKIVWFSSISLEFQSQIKTILAKVSLRSSILILSYK